MDMNLLNTQPERNLSPGPPTEKYLSVGLSGETFALPVSRVKKIVEFGHLTHVPLVPRFVRGIFDLLGHVLPVIDLEICFNDQITPVTTHTCIVVVEHDEAGSHLELGIMVEAVKDVTEIAENDILSPPAIGHQIPAEFIRGIIREAQGNFMLLLDIGHLFRLSELNEPVHDNALLARHNA